MRSKVTLGVIALAIGAAAACGSGASERAGPTSTEPRGPAATAACSLPRPGPPTSGSRSVTVDGTERTYLLALPEGLERRTAMPLIVSLHGFGGSAAELEEKTRLGERGADRGSIVATPDALGPPNRWNFDRRPSGPDDYAFIDALVADLAEQYCTDPDRTFVAGSSNGAAFAGLLACSEPYRFAAVAMVIATVPSACPETVLPAVITIRGTADTHVPYEGTPAMVAAYADRYGCEQPPMTETPHEGVERTRYTGCRSGSEVVLDAIVGGTHAWPGGTGSEPAGHASARAGYQATDEILDFFERHWSAADAP